MADRKKRIGLIGCGQWGPNQIRVFYFHPKAEVVRICDMDNQRLYANLSQYPHIQATQNSQEVTRADDIDAVIITTPVSTHYALSKDALLHGKDVLCEKPLTIKTVESRELIQIAEAKSRILMVGQVFLFNAGILKLKELIENKDCGESYYLHAQRTNLGPVRTDVNAVYDLASHDISIFNFLLNSTPKVLSAVGKCYLQPSIEDVAFVSLEYPENILAHIHVSWLDPKKVRQITVVGNKKMMTWDDLSLSGPVEIYSKHVEKQSYYQDYGEFHLLVKEGEVLIPHVKNIEPLKQQADHFIEATLTRKKPISDGESGARVVQVLEEVEQILAVSRSMNSAEAVIGEFNKK